MRRAVAEPDLMSMSGVASEKINMAMVRVKSVHTARINITMCVFVYLS